MRVVFQEMVEAMLRLDPKHRDQIEALAQACLAQPDFYPPGIRPGQPELPTRHHQYCAQLQQGWLKDGSWQGWETNSGICARTGALLGGESSRRVSFPLPQSLEEQVAERKKAEPRIRAELEQRARGLSKPRWSGIRARRPP